MGDSRKKAAAAAPKDAEQAKGEWPFPAAAQPGEHSEKLDESKLTRGERVTDTSTEADGGNPKAARGTYELTPDRGHESARRAGHDSQAGQDPKTGRASISPSHKGNR